MLGQRFDCISHEPVYLSRMSSLKETKFPPQADYVREFCTCVIKSKANTSDLQMGYLVNSRIVEGLSNDAVRRQYMVEVRSRWRSNRPFRFETLVETIAEAYIAAGYQLEELQNTSRTTSDHTLGPAVSRPLPMMVPPTSTSTSGTYLRFCACNACRGTSTPDACGPANGPTRSSAWIR